MTKQDDIEKMQNEVDAYAKKIEEICKTDNEIDSLYLGTQIYMSPLVPQSDLLFIGINPGGGSYKYGGVKPHRVVPLEKSEYETEEYALQDDWKMIFGAGEKINNLDLLYKGIKTNCSFFATKDSGELKKLKSLLKNKYKIDLAQKEKEWLKVLIQFVDPKIIICEGLGAFNGVCDLFPEKEFSITEDWPYHKKAYLNGYLPVLGFKRRIDSRFENPEDVVDSIYQALEETHSI